MSWLVYRLTNSPFALGVIGFASQITVFFISPFSGVWADRWNRHRAVIITQILSMLQAFVLAYLVISGNVRSLSAAVPLLKERGAKRVVALKVSVASHCPYMEKAKISLSGYLRDIDIAVPACSVIPNASAQPEKDPERIRNLLAEQLVRPVRFEESVRNVVNMGIRRFVEIGPRSVLAPLVKRIVPGVEVEVIANDAH